MSNVANNDQFAGIKSFFTQVCTELWKKAMDKFATKDELTQSQSVGLASENDIRAIVSGYSQSSQNSNQE